MPPRIVFVVLCVDDTGKETTHIFSTAGKAKAWADADPRTHIFYDYAIDAPERHEGVKQ